MAAILSRPQLRGPTSDLFVVNGDDDDGIVVTFSEVPGLWKQMLSKLLCLLQLLIFCEFAVNESDIKINLIKSNQN